ncbi:MAG: GAF domain-containing protein [Novosphingobium sp.]
MQVRFWGTRGSIAKPGPTTVRYGGNTSCVEVRLDDGQLLILDCGTGAHDLGRKLIAEGPMPLKGSVLISHTHWDHIQGIPFFAPFFIPGCEWDIYAPQGFGETLRTTLAGQMEYTYFPITPDAFGASIHYHNVSEGTFEIGGARIRTRYLNHPALTIGYRIEADGASLVYSCDHEPHCGCAALPNGEIAAQDAAHAEFMRRADLVMHDAQYTAEEYEAKAGWGHSTIDYAVNVAKYAQVRTLALTHHEPIRTDDAIDALLAKARANLEPGSRLQIVAAAEGMTIHLEASAPEPAQEQAPAPDAAAVPTGRAVLAVIPDPDLLLRVAQPAHDEGLSVNGVATVAEAVAIMRNEDPPLVVLDGTLPPHGMTALLRTSANVPKLVIGGNLPRGADDTVDHIAAGFSREYLRSRIRTWLMRGKFAALPACIPESEARRLAAVRSLEILDTPPEDRFDRFTRIASRLFNVPVSLISLIDENRQWFKSRTGTDVGETPRDLSFCAHAILEPRPLVVPDALQDDRFCNNPMVVGPPRVRFYAGVPLHVAGEAIGTLCLIDIRPREPSPDELRMLRDLGTLVEAELGRSEPSLMPLHVLAAGIAS